MSATSSVGRSTALGSDLRAGGRRGRRGAGLWEPVERAGGRTDLERGQAQIARGGFETPMAESQLNGADVGAGFQEMDGERVAPMPRPA